MGEEGRTVWPEGGRGKKSDLLYRHSGMKQVVLEG